MPHDLTITVLTDNAHAEGLCDEWGLSLHVRYGSGTALLDFGQSDAFARNAGALGIDLAAVDHAVLSHAHYDHSDGMGAFFARNDHARLHLSESCAETCWSTKGGTDDARYIGIGRGLLAQNGSRLSPAPTDRMTTIAPGIHLVPHHTPGLADKGRRDGMLLREDDGWRPDDFSHEMSLVFELEGTELEGTCERSVVVCSSCSHAGIDAILCEVREAFGDVPIAAFVGGLHLFREDDETIIAAAETLRTADVRALWTGHCTGEHALELLTRELPGRVHALRPGLSFTLGVAP